jgi:hypothetical protein
MASVNERDQSDGHEEETVGRRRRLHILVVALGTIAGAALGAFVPLVLLGDRHQPSSDVPGVKSFENLSLQHRDGTITYEQTPPAGGEHNPVWQNAGFYEQQVLRERAVHTLEHGAVRLKSVDDPRLQEFIVAYRKGPQTPEPGAPCTGAVEMNPRPKDKDRQ